MTDSEKLRELLEECKLQLEYLNEKFGNTGTTNALLVKIEFALAEIIPVSTAKLIMSISESLMKVQKVRDMYEKGSDKWNYHNVTITELERQLNELKK